MKINNQSGMTIVEVLLASVALFIVFFAAIEFAVAIKKRTNTVTSQRSYVNEYEKIANLVMADPKLFKISFDPTEKKKCELLEQSKLPIAWDQKNIYDVADCQNCPGRIGFVIQPYDIPTLRGVYKVTFRLTHTTFTQGQTAQCDGQTIQDAQQLEMIVGLR